MEQQLPEPEAHSRQEYQELVARRQSEVDATLEALEPDIELANLKLAYLYKQEDTDPYINYAVSVQEYLNSKWDYRGHIFAVSGHWYGAEPQLSMSESAAALSGELKRQEANDTRISQGFSVHVAQHENDIETAPYVSMLFSGSHVVYNTPIGIIDHIPMWHAEPHDVTLSYIRQASGEVISGNVEEFIDAIEANNSKLINKTQNQSSSFYTASLYEQQKFLQNITDDVSERIPSSNADNFVLLDDAFTTKLYVTSSANNSLNKLSARADTGSENTCVPVQGIILGVCIIDEVLNKGSVHYKQTGQMSKSKDGIGLIIQPDKATNSYLPEEYLDSDIIVPFNSLTSYNLNIV